MPPEDDGDGGPGLVSAVALVVRAGRVVHALRLVVAAGSGAGDWASMREIDLSVDALGRLAGDVSVVVDQARVWVESAHERGLLIDDRGREPGAAVAGVVAGLSGAARLARELAAGLDEVRAHTAHLGDQSLGRVRVPVTEDLGLVFESGEDHE